MSNRRCTNWLTSLNEYVENTETPRHFWLWAGLFCLNSALQRKVWIPYGINPIYPNLYIMLVAPPGRCRKGAPLSFAKEILREARIPQAVDSSSKRALTKELAEVSKTLIFHYNGISYNHASLAIVSRELSSLLAVDPKGIVEVLTDLFDSHDEWMYKTSERGEDKIYRLCINLILGTTPRWITKNLPEDAIGGGFTSRFVILFGNDKYKLVPRPPEMNRELYQNLITDLSRIAQLKGQFVWEDEAKIYFDQWYGSLDEQAKANTDENIEPCYDRAHIQAIKAAMGLQVAESDDLILTLRNVKISTQLIERSLLDAGNAFSKMGSTPLALGVDRVLGNIRTLREAWFSELLAMNYGKITKRDLDEILDNLESMGTIQRVWVQGKEPDFVIRYQKKGLAGSFRGKE